MMSNKVIVFFALAFFGILFSSLNLVSAQYYGYYGSSFADGLERAVMEAEPVVRLILGDVSGVGEFSAGEVLFAKLLVFVILVAIIHFALGRVPIGIADNTKLTFLIAVIVALLGTRYMAQSELISFIWLPYGVLGITLTSLLPLVIAFFFLNGFESSVIRRLGWTVFFVIFATLAYLRWDELSLVVDGFNLAWIYLIVAGICLFFFFRDRQIHAITMMSDINKISNAHKKIQAIDVQREISELQRKLAGDLTRDQRSAVERAILDKQKALKSLMRS